jgi:hypothetical protein
MSKASETPSRLIRFAALGCAAMILGGCGWTARDEFLRNRSLVFAPQAGDGSQITATPQTPAGITALTAPQVAQTPDRPSQRQP